MPNLDQRLWRRFSGTFSFSHDDPIDKVTIELVADDAVIRNDNNEDVPLYLTDLHFQPGRQLTGWQPETREFLKKIYHSNNEFKNRVASTDVYLGGKSPVNRQNVEFNEYNFTGRGIEVITIPNWYPDDWNKELLATGVDFEITPKDDYDFFRLCTNGGVLKDEDDFYKANEGKIDDANNPINIAYTQEFALGAGKAGVPIKILASTGKAYVGSTRVKLGGVNDITLSDGQKIKIRPRRMFLAQKGAIRYRIEFYKLSNRYVTPGGTAVSTQKPVLSDTGIGYYGTAKFNQWTYGRSRV
jgi:hypothetical protein